MICTRPHGELPYKIACPPTSVTLMGEERLKGLSRSVLWHLQDRWTDERFIPQHHNRMEMGQLFTVFLGELYLGNHWQDGHGLFA